jgi:2-polyprenyl-6-methoxyphenol hydroxylase-like FAD-dependent oxidoreductase
VEVVGIDQRPDQASAVVAGGEGFTGDLLVGADGLASTVRRHVLADGEPRYAGETIFRGIAEMRLPEPDLSRELFGDRRRTAYYELGHDRVYWWATAPLCRGTEIPVAERQAFLAHSYRDWGFGVAELYARTPAGRILQNDIFDRRPSSRWHRGRVVLLGDAAHPTTPNLGQGACMAIEDAVVLARLISRARSAREAFGAFYASRWRRTAWTARMSRLWGTAGLLRRPLAIRGRDAAMRRLPDGWVELGARLEYSYDPGGLA